MNNFAENTKIVINESCLLWFKNKFNITKSHLQYVNDNKNTDKSCNEFLAWTIAYISFPEPMAYITLEDCAKRIKEDFNMLTKKDII